MTYFISSKAFLKLFGLCSRLDFIDAFENLCIFLICSIISLQDVLQLLHKYSISIMIYSHIDTHAYNRQDLRSGIS